MTQNCPPSQPAPGRGQLSGYGRQRQRVALQAPEPRWAPLGAVPAQYQPSVPPAPTAAQKSWTWRILGVVLSSALLLFVCMALVGVGFVELDDARQGASVGFGETVTGRSGVGLTVTNPRTYYVDNESIVGPDEQAYEVVLTVVNGTTNPVGTSRITMSATVDTAPADPIYLGGLTTQDITPGQQLRIPFRFKVQDGPAGPLRIAVQDASNEPVVFTGSL
jgi:hypothetical protein